MWGDPGTCTACGPCLYCGDTPYVIVVFTLCSANVDALSQTTPPLEDVLSPSYLPATSDYFPAFVSAVDQEGTVWLQRVEGADPALLDSLVDTMTTDYSKLGSQVYL